MLKLHVFAHALVLTASGQINIPPASPRVDIKTTVGFAQVAVSYSAPSARGREIANNLIPYNEVWRTGANESTKITFSEAVKVAGQPVPAGQYALYTIFTEEKATVILSKDLTLWGASGYKASNDQLRFDVPVKHPTSSYETFTITFSDVTRNMANLNLKWGQIKIMFSIEGEVDNRVMAEITEKLITNKSQDAGLLYDGAEYYYDTNRDAKQALQWITQAIEASKEEQYWAWHLKAKLEARLQLKDAAKVSANKSMILARQADNKDYVRLNEQIIASMK